MEITDRDRALVLVALGTVFCWWTVTIYQDALPAPLWPLIVALALVALAAGLSAALSNSAWLLYHGASAVATFAGFCIGSFLIWPTRDPIGASYRGIVVIVITFVTAILSFIAVLIGRRISFSNPNCRRAIWLALFGFCAYGPIVLLLHPSIVALTVAHNDQVNRKRFAALQAAVTAMTHQDPEFTQTCDGRAISLHYSGPWIPASDWEHIAGKNGLQAGEVEDSYEYRISCFQDGTYSISAVPLNWGANPQVFLPAAGDGTLEFCADQTGAPKCGIGFNDWGTRICKPCSK